MRPGRHRKGRAKGITAARQTRQQWNSPTQQTFAVLVDNTWSPKERQELEGSAA